MGQVHSAPGLSTLDYVEADTPKTVRAILATHGRFPSDVAKLDDDANLFQAGLTSHASVNLMLALEDSFDVEFPDALLKRSTFETIASICSAVDSLLQAEAA
jgi:acyl carrier protein